MQRVPPFWYSFFNVRYKTERDYRVPPLNFFRHCDFFVVKRSPFKCFEIFQHTKVSKSRKGLPFLLFRHYETVSKFSFFVLFRQFFQNNFRIFLNISRGSPFQFLCYFAKKWIFKKSKRSPFCNFKNFALFEP